MRRAIACALVVAIAACGRTVPRVALTDTWPQSVEASYDTITNAWTRETHLTGVYVEELEISATFKSPTWRFAHAERMAKNRGLTGEGREQAMKQAEADAAGPYEIELMVTTWDRRENDLDRGKKSVWRVVMIDETGVEIEPIEIVKDKRPAVVVRAEFPALGEFATPYIVRFSRAKPLLGATVKQLRLRMSSERGGVEVRWDSI